MKLKLLVLGTTVPIAAAIINLAYPAQAMDFAVGNILQLNANFQNNNANLLALEFQGVNGTYKPQGNYGNFGIGMNSSGGFADFSTSGMISDNYKIRSVDFNDPSTYLNQVFLTADKGTDDFQFVITEVMPSINQGSGWFAIQDLKGAFTSSKSGRRGVVLGSLSGTYASNGNASNGNSNKGQFGGTIRIDSVEPGQAETTPEPATLLGLGLIGSLLLGTGSSRNKDK
jgi:hypothetical protein